MVQSEKSIQKSYYLQTHILIVDDDARIRELVARYLSRNNCIVVEAENAEEARMVLSTCEIDAVVLDIMMPGEDGLSLTTYIRQAYDLPVLLLTAKTEGGDRIKGLKTGADDYLVKPFEPEELLLRIQGLVKRFGGQRPPSSKRTHVIGPWKYDGISKTLDGKGQSISLTESEGDLLNVLIENAGKVVFRKTLAVKCGLNAESRSIDVQITRLRQKLEEDSRKPQFLQTVRGKGYILHIK